MSDPDPDATTATGYGELHPDPEGDPDDVASHREAAQQMEHHNRAVNFPTDES